MNDETDLDETAAELIKDQLVALIGREFHEVRLTRLAQAPNMVGAWDLVLFDNRTDRSVRLQIRADL